jgi:cytochrome c2
MNPGAHACCVATALLVAGLARADPPDDGRQAYITQCARCHGELSETRASRPEEARIVPVVMAPQGPNLTGIFGRPAGTIPGFRYSDALKHAAERGLVWNEQTLDRWLADSQAMLRGSYMFFKVQEPARTQVIRYLAEYSRYRN